KGENDEGGRRRADQRGPDAAALSRFDRSRLADPVMPGAALPVEKGPETVQQAGDDEEEEQQETEEFPTEGLPAAHWTARCRRDHADTQEALRRCLPMPEGGEEREVRGENDEPGQRGGNVADGEDVVGRRQHGAVEDKGRGSSPPARDLRSAGRTGCDCFRHGSRTEATAPSSHRRPAV